MTCRAANVCIALLGLGLWSCRAEPSDPDPWGPFHGDETMLAAVASQPDLTSIHRDLALLCPKQPGQTHHVGVSRCSVSRIGDAGQLSPMDIEQVLYVQRFDADRILVGTFDLHLQMLEADGTATPVARGVLSPRVAEDRRHVAWMELLNPADIHQMGVPTQVVLWDAVDDQRWVVSEDEGDASPFPVPNRREVLLVSRRSGLASYWLVGPDREPTQLTNAGLDSKSEDFVPLHSGELLWLPDGRAVYSAHYGEPQLWILDLDGAGARPLGPGRLPMLARDGVLAVVGHDDALQVVAYGEQELR